MQDKNNPTQTEQDLWWKVQKLIGLENFVQTQEHLTHKAMAEKHTDCIIIWGICSFGSENKLAKFRRCVSKVKWVIEANSQRPGFWNLGQLPNSNTRQVEGSGFRGEAGCHFYPDCFKSIQCILVYCHGRKTHIFLYNLRMCFCSLVSKKICLIWCVVKSRGRNLCGKEGNPCEI